MLEIWLERWKGYQPNNAFKGIEKSIHMFNIIKMMK